MHTKRARGGALSLFLKFRGWCVGCLYLQARTERDVDARALPSYARSARRLVEGRAAAAAMAAAAVGAAAREVRAAAAAAAAAAGRRELFRHLFCHLFGDLASTGKVRGARGVIPMVPF